MKYLGLLKIAFGLVEKICLESEEHSRTEYPTLRMLFILSRPTIYEVINLGSSGDTELVL